MLWDGIPEDSERATIVDGLLHALGRAVTRGERLPEWLPSALHGEGVVLLRSSSRSDRPPSLSVIHKELGLASLRSLGGMRAAREQITNTLLEQGASRSDPVWLGAWAGDRVYVSNGPYDMLCCDVEGGRCVFTTQGDNGVFIDPQHVHQRWSDGPHKIPSALEPYMSPASHDALFSFPANRALALNASPAMQYMIWRGWLLLAASMYPGLPPLVVRGLGPVGTNITRLTAAVMGVTPQDRRQGRGMCLFRTPAALWSGRRRLYIPHTNRPFFTNVGYTTQLRGMGSIVLWAKDSDADVDVIPPQLIEESTPSIMEVLIDDLLATTPLRRRRNHKPYWVLYMGGLAINSGVATPHSAASTLTTLVSQVGPGDQ